MNYKTWNKKKLKNPNYMMSLFEFTICANPTMPDELLEFIMSWEKIKKSPYNNKSYYNGVKGWTSFVDGGIRVSDHWNFYSCGNVHCKTIQTIKNETEWHVGVYDAKTDLYNIVKTYPIIQRKYSQMVRDKHNELNKEAIPPPEVLEKRRKLKQDMKAGKVFAILITGERVRVVKEGRHIGKQYINYELDGKRDSTYKYRLCDVES